MPFAHGAVGIQGPYLLVRPSLAVQKSIIYFIFQMWDEKFLHLPPKLVTERCPSSYASLKDRSRNLQNCV